MIAWSDFAGVTDDEGSGDSESEEEVVDENGVTRRVKKRKGEFLWKVLGGITLFFPL